MTPIPTPRTDAFLKEQAAAPVESQGLSLMLERFVSDPNASVEKIERLMALWERNQARTAETQFNAAMSKAQSEMRAVNADATNPQTRSRYASYDALDRALRPVYTTHGFGLSFDTGEAPQPDYVRVLCYVTHLAGHARTYHADMPADGKGAKGGDVMTKTHAVGSAMSYGMRYLLKMVFNVAVSEEDDDGNRAGNTKAPTQEPAGYQDWLDSLTAVADEGEDRLKAAWNQSKPSLRTYLTTNDPGKWAAMKAKSKTAGGAK